MNMKKLFPDDQEPKKGLLEFLDKKGFYIVLILCIAIVAGTAVFVTSQKAASDKQNYDAERIIPEENDNDSAADVAGNLNAQAQETQAAVVPNTDTPAANTADASKVASNDTAAANTAKTSSTKVTPAADKPKVVKPVAKPSTTKKAASTPAKVEFAMPVSGDITFDYAVEKLAYSKTLEEWRAHEGVDIAGDLGATVKAAADGVVSEVKNDPRYGIIVILEHSNGLKTLYANLASDDMVAPNQKIKKGDIIGSIGNTASFEAAEQSHLHFEVLKDNENVNPASYIPVKQVKN